MQKFALMGWWSRLSRRYLVLGIVAGLLAPTGLFAYALFVARPLDPFWLFVVMAVGGMITFGLAGWMIGRRDDALEARNRALRELSRRLQALSATDGLTGIANRRALDERLAIELARTARYGTPLALVMLDLDHFKELNDRLGHGAGDHVLREVARLLDREKRRGDLVARYGGEEFVAVLAHTDAASALAWAERARALVASSEFQTAVGPVRVTASLGVAEAAGVGADGAALLEQADRALYQAKRSGRNRVVATAAGAATPTPAIETRAV